MSDWNSGAESSSSDSQGVGDGGGGVKRGGRLGSSKEHSEEPIPEADVAEWRRQLQANTLSPKDLIDFFKGATPPLFLVDSARNPSDLGKNLFDESASQSLIIHPLEQLVWGAHPKETLDRLREKDNAPSVCGRVFKNGEPTYCCRECGMDPTCVLCVNCFKQSTHRHHKYKMSTSNGGGCCDCGDPEAWKKDAYCEQHKAGLVKKQQQQQQQQQNQLEGGSSSSSSSTASTDSQGLTQEQKHAVRIVLEAVMDFAAYSLEIDSNATIVDSDEDVYCTVLYNDETHVLEQVIQNLTKTIHCSSKDALDYITRVDHEGRAMVKCSSFDVCNRLKADMEKHSMRTVMQQKGQPLRIAILHKKAIAYQQFALQSLVWLQSFLMVHADVRAEFKELVTSPVNSGFNVKHILMNDHRLWKNARTSWHKVLIAGMLMEYENKKRLATIFTQTYATILQDHIRDDHDHAYSVASLSVQLFTVPTVAHYLIAEESAFFQLMHTFYSECVEKYVDGNVLTFVKNASNVNTFKRAAVILFDVRYLLHIWPETWTDELRKGFLHGVQTLIKLLCVMQGMDAVHRQTGSHIDYEPEWESAFNLHIKLERVISLVLEWCRTDKVVLVKVYRMVMAQLSNSNFIVGQGKREVQELANHSASCLMYDVSVKYVSIHLPLTRLFAGLYLQLEGFNLNYDTVSIKSQHKKASPEEIIEPVLCTQTMIAQVHAGMWRRNGYSLLNQLYFYGNVKCRSEMLDRDVAVLQIGASLIESNEFLIHAVNKFNLMNWVNVQYEEEDTNNVGTSVNMVDELLELLIVIVGERFVVGIGCVTEEDCVRKELMQQLCIKPFSHSELNRALPDVQQLHETNVMELVMEQIATFKKPQVNDKKGVYELKAEFYAGYNMYFYHYSKEDKSKSEEAQRKRQNNKNACCLPPQLPKLTESFSLLANLLQCDVMFQLMTTVMKRACDLKAGLFAESHVQKILYLIGYGLQEEETGHYPFLMFYERALKWKIPEMLADLLKSPRVETQTSFIQWAIDKFEAMKPKPQESEEQMETGGGGGEGQSKLAAEEQSSTEAAELREKKRLAAERQAKIMAQMMSAQKKFMSVNAEHFAASPAADDDDNDEDDDEGMDWDQSGATGAVASSIACLGAERKVQLEEDPRETCILCSEAALVNGSATEQHLVYSCFVQKSNVIYGPALGVDFPHVSSCGHVMHASCYREYFKNERAKENRRPHRQRSPGSFDIDKKEFLCPLCRCLSNTVLPLNQSLAKIYAANGGPKERLPVQMEFGVWLEVMRSAELFRKSLPEMTLFQRNAEKRAAFEALCPPVNRSLLPAMNELILDFAAPLKSLQLGEPQGAVLLWRACTYTIQSIEMVLRATNKPLRGNLSIRQSNCLSGLIRVCGLMGTGPESQVQLTNFDKFSLYTSSDSLLHMNVFERLLVTLFYVPAMVYKGDKEAEEEENVMTVDEKREGDEEAEAEGGERQEQKKAKSETEAMDDAENMIEVVPDSHCGMATGQMMDFYNLRLAFVLNMIKIIIVYDPTKEEEELSSIQDPLPPTTTTTTDVDVEMPTTGAELPNLLTYYQNHNLFIGRDRERQRRAVTSRAIVEEVKHKSQTFLRSSCLLFHFLTGVEMPEEFACLGGDSFELMCEYLGLSTNLESYFQCEQTLQFVTARAMHQEIIDLRKALQRVAAEEQAALSVVQVQEIEAKLARIEPAWLPVRRLVELPEDYSDLINSVSLFTCPNSNLDDSRNPTMCLVCGQVLCSQTYCCRFEKDRNTVGACTYHASSCNNEVAPFLQIRECQVMLLGMNKGCMVLPPYLDEYGETDQGLRRGNPLTLCGERYNRLHLMWLSHSLHEEISRAIETANSIGGTQWHLL